MEKSRNVEQDIIDSARKVFQEKGYKEATMRDIAAEANINLAMLHYYFRSKDNLFYIVFDEAFRLLYEKIVNILTNNEMNIFGKIKTIVGEYVSFFHNNPTIPQFITGEIIRNPERVGNHIKKRIEPAIPFKLFSEQLQKEFENGIICQISPLSLVLNILSLCIFPEIAKPVIKEVLGMETLAMDAFIESRKTEIADFIINSLRT